MNTQWTLKIVNIEWTSPLELLSELYAHWKGNQVNFFRFDYLEKVH